MALENPAAAAKSRSPRARLVRAAGAAAALGAAMICLAAMVFRDKLLARLNPPPALAVAPVASGLRQPTDIANSGVPGDERLFVLEREGRIGLCSRLRGQRAVLCVLHGSH